MGEKGSDLKSMDLGDAVAGEDHVNGELLKELRIDAGGGDGEETDEISSSFKAGPREVYYLDQSLWRAVKCSSKAVSKNLKVYLICYTKSFTKDCTAAKL